MVRTRDHSNYNEQSYPVELGGDCGTTSILSSLIFSAVGKAVDNLDQAFTKSGSGSNSMDGPENIYSHGHLDMYEDPNKTMNGQMDRKVVIEKATEDGCIGSNDSTVLYISSSDESSEISAIDYTSIINELSENNTPHGNAGKVSTPVVNNGDRATVTNQKQGTPETIVEKKEEDKYLIQLSKTEIDSRSSRKGIENESKDKYSVSSTQVQSTDGQDENGNNNDNKFLEDKENGLSSLYRPSSPVSLSASLEEDLSILGIHPTTVVAGKRLYTQAMERYQRLARIADSDGEFLKDKQNGPSSSLPKATPDVVAGQRLYNQAMERFERLSLIADSHQEKRKVRSCPSRSRSSTRSGDKNKMENEGTAVKPRYLQLYETRVEQMRRSRIAKPVKKSTMRSPSPSIRISERDRCCQLYNLSKEHQEQGRKRREEIRKASLKAKEVPNLYSGHISTKDAERLYYEGIKHIIDLDNRRVVAAEQLEIECQTYRFREELRNKVEESTQWS